MPRRRQVRQACQWCRKKRSKCDGEDPCERCREAGLDCTFDRSRRESKDDLRAEVERLRRANEQSDALLGAMSSMEDLDACKRAAQRLMDGTVTREDLVLELSHKSNSSGTPSSPCGHVHTTVPSGFSTSGVVAMTCANRDEPLPMPTSSPRNRDGSLRRNSDESHAPDEQSGQNVEKPISVPSPFCSIPPLADRGVVAVVAAAAEGSGPVPPGLGIDGWTRTGWATAVVLEHLESLLLWDYLPFCLLCKDSFLRDLKKGTGQYCSRALVNALLALARRVISEQHHDQRRDSVLAASIRMPPYPQLSATAQVWTNSQAFFNEAQALVAGHGSPNSLPDTQALGIMALYLVGCGRESEALELARAFAAATTKLCLQAPVVADKREYMRVRATTYCGAISLVRMMKLTTAQPSGFYATVIQDDGVILDHDDSKHLLESKTHRWIHHPGAISKDEAWWHTTLLTAHDANTADADQWRLDSIRVIPAKIFQLTEWVYKLLASPESASGDEVVSVYRQCLDWYESFFTLLKSGGSKSPFILFIHIYYHFCLLSLFRPFYNVDIGASNVYPREICLEAAQSILKLTQSYASLYGLSRVPSLVPYFVNAAKLLSAAVEGAGDDMLNALPEPTRARQEVHQAVSPFAITPPDSGIETEPDGDDLNVDKNRCLVSS